MRPLTRCCTNSPADTFSIPRWLSLRLFAPNFGPSKSGWRAPNGGHKARDSRWWTSRRLDRSLSPGAGSRPPGAGQSAARAARTGGKAAPIGLTQGQRSADGPSPAAANADAGQTGALQAARAALEHALSLAEPAGMARTFLDHGLPLVGLLRQARHSYATRLLAAVEPGRERAGACLGRSRLNR